MSSLIPFWYIVIAILWTGFFILEGFDFGVGMLHAVVGTDEAGRDVLVRLMVGGQMSLLVGLVATVVGGVIGLIIGVFSGYFGGQIDALLMRFTDGMIAEGGRVHDRVFAALRQHLPDEQILMLTYFVNMYALHATSTKALRLEYDDVPERVVEIPAPETRRVQDWRDSVWADTAAK